MEKSTRRVLKVILIILALLAIVTAIILYNVSPSGYCYNLYSQLPWYFWALSIVGLVASAALTALFIKNGEKLAKVGGLLALIFFLQILLTPFFLGYLTVDRSDAMYVPGEIHTIYSSGHYYQNYDKYPLVSILYSMIFMILNVSYLKYATLVPALFSIMFLFALYKTLREVEPKHGFAMYLIVLMSLVYYGSYYQLTLHPAWYGFVLSVLLIYLLVSRRFIGSLSGELLIGSVVITLPFAHPYYITASIMLLAAITAYAQLKDKRYRRIYQMYLIISTVVFLTWIIHNQAAYWSLQNILNALKHAYLVPAGVEGTEKAATLTFSETLMYIFGHLGRFSWIFLLLTVLFITSKNKKQIFLSHMRLWYTIFVLASIQLSMLVLPIFAHNPDRYTNVNYLSIALPMGVIIISQYIRWNRILKSVASLLVILALVTSVFSLYYNPHVSLRPNLGITSNEIVSTSFIFTHRGTHIFIFSPYDQIVDRYCGFMDLATAGTCSYKNIRYLYQEVFPPKHFGYLSYHRFTLLISIDRAYIVMTDYALQTYLYVGPFRRTHRITWSDYIHMNSDSHLNKIYSGLNVRIYEWFKNTKTRRIQWNS